VSGYATLSPESHPHPCHGAPWAPHLLHIALRSRYDSQQFLMNPYLLNQVEEMKLVDGLQ